MPCSSGEEETGNSRDDANRRKAQDVPPRKCLPNLDSSGGCWRPLVTCGVTRECWERSTQYSVLSTQFEPALGFAVAGRPRRSSPHELLCVLSTEYRVLSTASVGTGSFLDGAKVFSLGIWGCELRGGESGLEGAKPWWMQEFQFVKRRGNPWPAGCLFQ